MLERVNVRPALRDGGTDGLEEDDVEQHDEQDEVDDLNDQRPVELEEH